MGNPKATVLILCSYRAKTCAGYSLIRREKEDYHSFTLIVSREQQNGQNP